MRRSGSQGPAWAGQTGKEVANVCGWMKEAKAFYMDEQGIGVIEVVLILVVLIGLVIIFKKQISTLLESIFKEINKQSKEVY